MMTMGVDGWDARHAVERDHGAECRRDRLTVGDVEIGTQSGRTRDQAQVPDVPGQGRIGFVRGRSSVVASKNVDDVDRHHLPSFCD